MISTAVKDAYAGILLKINNVLLQNAIKQPVSLIAVSKTKPVEAILEVYEAGQRDFGENYVDEVVEKATIMADKYKDIRWHFIGHLQSNKVPKVLSVPIYCIQSIDSVK